MYICIVDCRGFERYGKSSGAHKRDAKNSRRIRSHLRSLVQATSKILQAGKQPISSLIRPSILYFIIRIYLLICYIDLLNFNFVNF